VSGHWDLERIQNVDANVRECQKESGSREE
jgi:hypothetical protein